LTQCFQGKVVYDSTSPGTNLWEATIFYDYGRGLRFSGVNATGSGPATNTAAGVWNWRATDLSWEGSTTFVVAEWRTPQDCGGYCLESKSWLNLTIIATPLPDP
jgi:hypothetical protein